LNKERGMYKNITFFLFIIVLSLTLTAPSFSEESQYGWKYLKFGMDKETVEKLLKENGDLKDELIEEYSNFISVESKLIEKKNWSSNKGNLKIYSEEDNSVLFFENKLYGKVSELFDMYGKNHKVIFQKIKAKYPNGRNIEIGEEFDFSDDEELRRLEIKEIYQYTSDDGEFGVHSLTYCSEPRWCVIKVFYYDKELYDKLESKRIKEIEEELEREREKESKELQEQIDKL